MTEIRVGNVSGYVECPVAKSCLHGSSGPCSIIDRGFDGLDAFSSARKAGLKPEKISAFFRRSNAVSGEQDTRLEFCERARQSDDLVRKLQDFLPEEFVNDEDELATLMEVHSVATGDIQDPDLIMTEQGFEMLDRITSDKYQPYPDRNKLAVLNGQLEVVPIYEQTIVE